MKRLSAIVICVLAFTLIWASTASASRASRHIDSLRVQHRAASGPAGSFAQGVEKTYSLTGTMEDFDGNPLTDCWVVWGWYDPDGYSWFVPDALFQPGGETSTSRDGSFSFANVTSHPGHDSLMAGSLYGTGLNYMILYHLDFSTTGSYVLRPGHVSISVAHAPAGMPVTVALGDALYSALDSSVVLKDGYGAADAAPPDFTSARASFPNANGTVTAECEWVSPGHAPVTVTPGVVAGTPLVFDWNSAVRGRLLGPQCRHSGRPGSTVKYSISGLPAGQQTSFYGQSWSPYDWGVETYPQVVNSAGPQNTYTVALRVPERATVGDVYEIEAQRSDDVQSMLWLYDYYEVCTFDASQSTVAPGQAVRLSGQIDGRAANLFRRDTPAGQPASPAADGWTEVGKLVVKAGGTFVSQQLRPSRTTWYVVRYDGVNGGFTAFTPVVKVAVR